MAFDYSTAMRGMISLNHFDMDLTDWAEGFGTDYIVSHNPSFRYLDTTTPHKLEQVLAILCEDGSMDMTLNMNPYHLEKNDMIIVLAGNIMEDIYKSQDFSGTYIFMSGKFLDGLNIGDSYRYYQSVETKPIFHLTDDMAEGVKQYIGMVKSIIRISSIHPHAEESVFLVNKAVFLLLGWFLHKDAVSKEMHTHESEIMSTFIGLVKKNYTKNRDVEFYADKMNMTPKYMSTVIKKASGKTALQFIEEYVVLDAKAQLSSSIKPVQEIAYDLNFPNQSFFGRYFKRVTGLSPSEYRLKIRQQKQKDF